MSLSKHQQADLPELCLLAIVSQMSLVDRINAHQTCPQWYHRVREINQTTVRSLTIANFISLRCLEEFLNGKYILDKGYRSGLHLLAISSNGRPAFPLHHLTAWNCLQFSSDKQLNSATTQQIMSALPQLTELIYFNSTSVPLKCLMEMLQAKRKWRVHLTRLTVYSQKFAEDDPLLKSGALIDSINALPALQYLTLSMFSIMFPHKLPILARLKKISIEGRVSKECLTNFLHSLQQYTSGNAEDLRVNLFTYYLQDAVSEIFQLNEPVLRRCFTCLSSYPLTAYSSQKLFSLRLTTFPNLTSLKLRLSNDTITPAFFVLAQLRQLVQLSLIVKYIDPPSRPLRDQLLSVKVLYLYLILPDHSPLQWLNLPVTMPNVHEINLEVTCSLCEHKARILGQPRRDCLCVQLRMLMEVTGLPAHRITCYLADLKVSSEELLGEEQLN